jgi:hypothetical protein
VVRRLLITAGLARKGRGQSHQSSLFLAVMGPAWGNRFWARPGEDSCRPSHPARSPWPA